MSKYENVKKKSKLTTEEFCKIMEGASTSAKEYAVQTKGAIGSTEAFAQKQKMAQAQLEATSKASLGASIGMKALSIAGNMFVMLAISKGIELAAKGIDELANSSEHCKERVGSLMESYNSSITSANNNAKRIEEMANDYKTLSKGVNDLGENVSLTSEEYEKYNDIVNEIAQMFPTLVQGHTEEGNAILTVKGNVEELRDAYKDAQKEAYNLLIMSGKSDGGKDIVKQWKNTQKTSFISKFFDLGAADVGGRVSSSEAVTLLKEIENMKYEEYLEIKSLAENGAVKDVLNLSDVKKDILYDKSGYLSKELGLNGLVTDKEYAEIQKQARALVQTYNAEIESALKDVRTLAEAYLMTNPNYDGLNDQIKTSLSKLVNSIDENVANEFKDKTDVGAYVDTLVTTISNNESAKKALTALFTMDKEDMSVEQIQTDVDSYISTISNILKNILNEDSNKLKLRLGFDDSETQTLVNNVKKKLKGSKFDDKVTSLNMEDLKIASKLEVPNGSIKSWDELINCIKDYKKESENLRELPTIEQLLNTGELSAIRDELFDLARAGKLDKDTLESTEEFADLLALSGLEADKALDQIKELAQATDDLGKMDNFASGLDKLKNAYESFKNNEVIDSSVLSEIQNIFGSGTEEFQNFKDAVMNGSGDIQGAFNQLANSYLDTTGALDGLTEANKKHYIEELKSYGIVNAQSVVESRLAGIQSQRQAIVNALSACNSNLSKTNADLVITTNNLENATWQEIYALIEESGQSKNTAQALAVYALKKALANAEQIHEEESINQIKRLAETAGIASSIVSNYINAKNGNIKDTQAAQKIYEEYQKQLNSVESKYNKKSSYVAPKITTYTPEVPDHRTNNENNKKSKQKEQLSEFKQEIDWCEQSITKLSNAIGLLEKKLDNTKSYKRQISFLNSLIVKQQKLSEAYKKTANVYSNKYQKALSKLSKSDRKKVEDGTYTIEQFKGKAKSGEKSGQEKRYDNIERALKFRDELAKTNQEFEDSIKQMEEYAKQLAEIPWNKAEEQIDKLSKKIDLLDSKLNNANGYSKKNKILSDQLSLQKQIVKQYETALKTENSQLANYKKPLDKLYSNNSKSILSKINKSYKQKSDYNKDGTLKVDKKASKEQIKLINEYNKSISKLNAISDNKKLSTTGLTGDALRIAQKYNTSLEEIQKNTIQLRIEQENLKNQTNETLMSQFENIQSDYDRYSSIREKQIEEINNKMDLVQSKGRNLGSGFYIELMRLENADLKKAIEEKKKLKVQLDKTEAYTDDWYEMKLAIYECENEIQQSTISIQEYQNAIDELDWSNFERLQDLMNNLINESEFLIEVLSSKDLTNDKGLTAEGLSSLGLHAENYDTYMAQADYYAKKVEELNKKIEAEPYNQTYIEKRDEYLKAQQDSIKSALSEKQAVIELTTEGYEAQYDALEETINKKKELLKSEEDLYNFRKKVQEQTKAIADIEKQINALEGDDSEENRKKLQQLKSDLAEAQSNLEDTMHNQSVGDIEDGLDEVLNNSRTQLDEYLKDSEKVFIDSLATVNSNTQLISDTLKSTAKEVGYTISDELVNSWNKAGKAVTNYNNTFADISVGIITSINGIKNAWQDAVKAYENYANATVTASQNKQSDYTKNSASADDIYDFINENKQKASQKKSYYLKTNQYIYEKTGGYVLSKANELKLAELLGMNTKGVTEKNITKEFRNSILDKLKNAGFSSGGYVDASMIKQTGEDGLALVRHGEPILTQEQGKQFKTLINNLDSLNNLVKLPTIDIIESQRNLSPIYSINTNVKVDGIATDEVANKMGMIVSKEVESKFNKINQQSYMKGVRKR